MDDLKDRIKYDLEAHPLDRDPVVLALAADRIAELEAEVRCYCELQDKLSVILTNTANALKGEPDELSVHSWHDLAEVATELKTQLKTAKRDGILEAVEKRKYQSGFSTTANTMHDVRYICDAQALIHYANSLTGEEL